MVKPGESGDWREYQQLVLSKLEEIKEVNEKMEVRLRGVELDLALVKLKSSFWGGLAGLGTFAATWAIQWISKRPGVP